jgi:predicted regulator of Ras-like GTPase activity (Roadblock/LC7/MglB family)
MNFSETLNGIVNRVEGAVSAMIIGTDGMPVEEYDREKVIDLTALGAETSQMMRDIKFAAENLGLGEAKEFSIISDLCGIIMRKINDEYFLALIIRPEGNYGKGRYVLRSEVARLEQEF